jgi:dsRNA-specific ribonuclease
MERLHAEGTPASERLLASTIEAIFGAIALEAGHPKAKEIILGQISALENFATESEFNAKGALQELLQPTVPTEDICYQCLSEDGPPNNRRYTMGIKIGQIEIPELRETAPTKKQAQNKVAAAALKKLKTDRHLLEKITNSYHRDC